MKQRFTMFRRGQVFYCQDRETGNQESLRTKDNAEALTLLHSKNEAFRHRAAPITVCQLHRGLIRKGGAPRLRRRAAPRRIRRPPGAAPRLIAE
jgi:hypothetical protein